MTTLTPNHALQQIRPSRPGRPGWQPNDLNDALAALWSAMRIASGVTKVFGSRTADQHLLRMEMWS